MKRIQIFGLYAVLLGSATMLTGCGPNSDTVMIRVRTGLEHIGDATNLVKLFLPPSINPVDGYCVQKNLYVGTDNGVRGGISLSTQRIDIRTAYSSSAAYSITAADLANPLLATFPPIQIPVPRGLEVGIGVLGSLSDSQRLDPDGIHCADFTALPAPTPYATTSVVGHRRIVANASMDIPLKLWVTPTNVNPSPTPTGGDPACANEADENQNCPSLDFLQVICSGCYSVGLNLRFEYARDRDDPGKRVVQWVPASQTAGSMNIPSILPIRLTGVNTTTSVETAPLEIRDDMFTNGSGTLTLTLVDPSIYITVLKRPRTLAPPLPAMALRWAQTSPTNSLNPQAQWTVANSPGINTQTIQLYSDNSCTVSSGTSITLSDSAVNSTFSTLANGIYTYQITTNYAAGASLVSSCSPPMIVDTTPPPSPTGLTWAPTSVTFGNLASANWQLSSLTDIVQQEIQFFSATSCTTAIPGGGPFTLPLIAGSNSYSFTPPSPGISVFFKITTRDTANNISGACSTAGLSVSP